MLTVDYSRPIAITAASPLVTVPADALPWRGITRFFVAFTGANNVLGGANGISQVTVQLNGEPYCILPDIDLLALSELMSPRGINYGITSLSFTLPFDECFERVPDSVRELSQLPAGQVELLFQFRGAFASAGAVVVGVEKSDQTPQKTLQYWNRPLASFAASTPNLTFPFSAPGRVRAYVLERTGLARARFVLGNTQVHKFTGPQFPSGPDISPEMQRWNNLGAVTATTKRAYYVGNPGLPAPADSGTYLEADTGAAWPAGSTLTIVTTRDLQPTKAA